MNLNFQLLFEELFFEPIKGQCLEIFARYKYDLVILAPYKIERMFAGFWHPNILFEKVLTSLQNSGYKFTIISTHYTSKKNLDVNWKNDLDTSRSPKKILLCDDVLTTGKSSLIAYDAFQNRIECATWHLFTIFRAPQK